MSRYLVSVQRRIQAPPQTLFDIVADPAQHPVIDGSGSVRRPAPGNPTRLSLGVRFGMGMRIGLAYRMASVVTEFEEGRRIAWRPGSGHTWRYLFDPVDDGAATLVTEQWDARRVWNRAFAVLAGFARRNRRGIIATLDRLEAVATGRGESPRRDHS